MAGIIFLDMLNRGKKRRISNKSASNNRVLQPQDMTGRVKRQRNMERCRICLKVDQNMAFVQIFSKITGQSTAENIRIFGDIEINEEDGLPKVLCQKCYNLLQGAIKFRKHAQASNRRLRAQINSSSNIEFDGEQNDEFNCKSRLSILNNSNELSQKRSSDCKRRVQCPDCQQTLLRRELPAHRARAHAPVTVVAAQPYVCDICGKCFAVKSRFKRHRAIHSDQLPHTCQLCPYRGRFRESLLRHMRVHTGEKPYACDQCPSRFMDCSNLRKHMQTHRGHEYKCDMCERGFYTKPKLQEHLRVDHTGIKEHKCDICDKEFAHRKQMMKHTRKVHKRAALMCGRLPLYLQAENRRREQEQSQEPAEKTISCGTTTELDKQIETQKN